MGVSRSIKETSCFILQPDVSHIGGIMELKNIAAIAEVNYAGITPHCPLGPIALAFPLQVDVAIPNFLIQEHATLGEGYLIEPFKIKNGYMDLP